MRSLARSLTFSLHQVNASQHILPLFFESLVSSLLLGCGGVFYFSHNGVCFALLGWSLVIWDLGGLTCGGAIGGLSVWSCLVHTALAPSSSDRWLMGARRLQVLQRAPDNTLWRLAFHVHHRA